MNLQFFFSRFEVYLGYKSKCMRCRKISEHFESIGPQDGPQVVEGKLTGNRCWLWGQHKHYRCPDLKQEQPDRLPLSDSWYFFPLHISGMLILWQFSCFRKKTNIYILIYAWYSCICICFYELPLPNFFSAGCCYSVCTCLCR